MVIPTQYTNITVDANSHQVLFGATKATITRSLPVVI